VGNTYQLFWIGSGPIAPLIGRLNIKPGDHLYTRPAPVQGVVKSDQEIHDIAWSIGGVDGGGYYFDTPELLKFIKQVTTQEAGR
jgi:hypothetical protein